MSKLDNKLAGVTAILPSSRCMDRFYDMVLLDYDLDNPHSLIRKKLTDAEIVGVRKERHELFYRCMLGGSSKTPFLYSNKALAQPEYVAAKAKFNEESMSGPYMGVKADDGHH